MFFDVGGAAVPELGEVAGGVIDGGGVAAAELAFEAGGEAFAVDAVVGKVVAGVAGDVLAFREAGLVEEHAAEVDLGVGEGIGFRGDDLREFAHHAAAHAAHGLGVEVSGETDGEEDGRETNHNRVPTHPDSLFPKR